MPLYYKPHVARRYRARENVSPSTFEVRGLYFDDAVEDEGMLAPAQGNTVFDSNGVEVSRPHMWMWDSENDYEPNDLVIINKRWFMVAKPQQIFDAEPITAHRVVFLEEINPEPAQAANPEI